MKFIISLYKNSFPENRILLSTSSSHCFQCGCVSSFIRNMCNVKIVLMSVFFSLRIIRAIYFNCRRCWMSSSNLVSVFGSAVWFCRASQRVSRACVHCKKLHVFNHFCLFFDVSKNESSHIEPATDVQYTYRYHTLK